jgi:3-deoxy-D-manno-octulosonate 8-phosphate phosphatase KdsC-like HAD superfamily phosphatase
VRDALKLLACKDMKPQHTLSAQQAAGVEEEENDAPAMAAATAAAAAAQGQLYSKVCLICWLLLVLLACRSVANLIHTGG